MHFKLLRYFSIANAVAILALAAALLFFYGRSAETQLVSTVEHDNIVLATAMANEIVGAFPEHFQVPHTPDTLNEDHHRRHIVEIDRRLRRLVEASPIIALNVFWNDLTIYSSQQKLIGTIKKSPGFLIARRGGKAVSNLVFKETFNVFEGEVMDRDIVETYVPVRLPDHLAHIGATLILEIYTDVSTVIAKIARTKRQLLAGLVLGFGALYVMLFLIVRHADTIISRHDKRFTDFAEMASDWFWEMDENLRFSYFFGRNFEITGYQPSDLIGKTRAEMTAESVDDEKWCQHLADLDARRPFKDFSYEFLRPDGKAIWISISGRPIFDANGSFKGYRGTGSDITERKRAEEELIEQQMFLSRVSRLSTMGEMAASLAHELNQPLTAITNYAKGTVHRLRSGEGDSDELLAVMEHIADQALRAGDIIRELRQFVGQGALKKSPVDINSAISDAITLLAGEAHAGGVKLALDLPEWLPKVAADEIQIHQVIINLARNAMEAMADHGSNRRQMMIRAAQAEGNFIEVTVTDTGPGIAPDALEHMFDAFFTTKAGGMGMGMSISNSIVKAHGGRLWVTSDSGGSTVHFTVPVSTGDTDDHA